MQIRTLSSAGIAPIALAFVGSLGAAQFTQRVSISTSGAQADAGSGPRLSISVDGRYVAFWSEATNLVTADTNGQPDVFVHDRWGGATELVSVDSSGAQADSVSSASSISADGRFVAFESFASNLVAAGNSGVGDVFVRDRANHTTEQVSVHSSGAQGDAYSAGASISADGRYVAFSSEATNLVSPDTNGVSDVFMRDRQLGTTERISVGVGGAQGNHESGGCSLSPDGRYVAFQSEASNLVAFDTNGYGDVFVRDRLNGTTTRASVDTNGTQGDQGCFYPSVSADGRFVAFTSSASNLVLPGNTMRIFVRDRQLATTELISVDSAGAQANNFSFHSSISANGRLVAFDSFASNLVSGDTNGRIDVFVRDRLAGITTRVSVGASGGEGDSDSSSPAFSADGHYVAFQSYASNLVPGDTNASSDCFVRDVGLPLPTTFCTSGTTSSGCVASIGTSGAPSASSGAGFTITVGSVEGLKQGIVFYGINNTGFTPSSWGATTSYLCVKAPAQRTGVQNSGGTINACNGILAADWNAFVVAHPGALGSPFNAGQHVFAQGWFRDPPSPKTSALSNAIEFVVGP